MSQIYVPVSGASPEVLETLTGNDGIKVSPSGNNINIVTAGTNIIFDGTEAPNTLTLDFSNTNIFVGSVPSGALGTSNITLGQFAGQNGNGFEDNILIGQFSGATFTDGSFNLAIGTFALSNALRTSENMAIGYESMEDYVGSPFEGGNTAIGYGSLRFLESGSNNLALGLGAGQSYGSGENNNITIGNSGVAAENNVLRIGTQGSGSFQQNQCFIAGIDGVNLGVARIVTENLSQLGTAVITAGPGVTITLGVNLITLSSNGVIFSYTNVAGPTTYNVLSTDYYISCDTSGGAITINLPNSPTQYQSFVVKDRTGNSSANEISITTPLGSIAIDGTNIYVLSDDYESAVLLWNGTSYEIF